MFGPVCKGLHCAGCGKGIPLGVVVIILALGLSHDPLITGALAHAIIWAAVILASAYVATMAVITTIYKRGFVLDYSRWDGPTYVEQKETEEWHKRAVLGRSNPFVEEDTAPVYVDAD